jgi:NAD(P)H-flavin reductase
MQKNYANFDFSIYLSREKNEVFQTGYVTNYLDPDRISSFDEFYICGSPALVKETRELLKNA